MYKFLCDTESGYIRQILLQFRDLKYRNMKQAKYQRLKQIIVVAVRAVESYGNSR
jgi:hypothetical protein